METLRCLELADNTLVIFTSDNGGASNATRAARGSKSQLYEGGIRVPLAVWWSGIARPGSTCNVPIVSLDFYPTLLELAGAPHPAEQALDGASLLPLLKGAARCREKTSSGTFPVTRAGPHRPAPFATAMTS